MEKFKSFFNATRDRRRHMRPISRITKKHPGSYVPVMHRAKMENAKFTNIKNGTTRIEYLNHNDIQQLQKKFRFTPSIKKSVFLGNTGIKLTYQNGKFTLTK